MANRKQPVKGVPSSVTDELLTWADGSLVDAELYEDYTTEAQEIVDNMSQEEIYVDSLLAGLRRDLRVEARIDMAEVKRLLAASGRDLPEA